MTSKRYVHPENSAAPLRTPPPGTASGKTLGAALHAQPNSGHQKWADAIKGHEVLSGGGGAGRPLSAASGRIRHGQRRGAPPPLGVAGRETNVCESYAIERHTFTTKDEVSMFDSRNQQHFPPRHLRNLFSKLVLYR